MVLNKKYSPHIIKAQNFLLRAFSPNPSLNHLACRPLTINSLTGIFCMEHSDKDAMVEFIISTNIGSPRFSVVDKCPIL